MTPEIRYEKCLDRLASDEDIGVKAMRVAGTTLRESHDKVKRLAGNNVLSHRASHYQDFAEVRASSKISTIS